MVYFDTTTGTRQQYTDKLCGESVPSNAAAQWSNLLTATQTLAKALNDHSAMVPNLQQTYSTPANSKNKVYFMWDFVTTTLVSPFDTP